MPKAPRARAASLMGYTPRCNRLRVANRAGCLVFSWGRTAKEPHECKRFLSWATRPVAGNWKKGISTVGVLGITAMASGRVDEYLDWAVPSYAKLYNYRLTAKPSGEKR